MTFRGICFDITLAKLIKEVVYSVSNIASKIVCPQLLYQRKWYLMETLENLVCTALLRKVQLYLNTE